MSSSARSTFDGAMGGQERGEKDLSGMSKQYSSRDLPGHTKLKNREKGQGTNWRKELEGQEEKSRIKRQKVIQAPAVSLDADDPMDEDDSDSDGDNNTALLAELQQIRKERIADNAKKEMEKRQEEERIRTENILSGNPLLNYSYQTTRPDMKVKRRWNDDVVFKNCARSESKEKHNVFINDSLRSEFHRKFMEKNIK